MGEPGEDGPAGVAGDVAPGTLIWTQNATPPAGYSFTGATVATGDRWIDIATAIPEGENWAPAAAVLAGKLYVFGGYGELVFDGGEEGETDFTQIYDIAAGTWSVGAELPSPRSEAVAVVLDGLIYVVGGYDYDAFEPAEPYARNTLYRYDPATDQWESLEPMSIGRVAPAVAVLGGKIYVAGGWYQEEGFNAYLDTAETYDPQTDQWSALPDCPYTPGYWPLGGSDGTHFYVAGGYVFDENIFQSYEQNNLVSYDPIANAWQTRAPMTIARDGAMGGFVNGRFYVGGGQADDTTNVVEEYDPLADRWTTRSPLPRRMSYGGSAVLENAIYVVGGDFEVSGSFWDSDKVTTFTPPRFYYQHVKD